MPFIIAHRDSYDFERPKTRICAKCYREGSWFYCRDCTREGDLNE